MPELSRTSSDYDFIAILRLQMLVRALEKEALGRYLSNPENLEAISAALKRPFPILAELKASPTPPLEGGTTIGCYPCPCGWDHMKDCSCVIDRKLPGDPEQPASEAEVLAEILHVVRKLLRKSDR